MKLKIQYNILKKMMKTEAIINRLMITEGGFKEPSDDFFANKQQYFPKYLKKGVITVDEEEDHHSKNNIFCNIPGCESFFQSVYAYQSHYNSLHRYICSQCKKSLPTPHLLDLHLSENHDSYFFVLSKSKPMYICFIEECTHNSSTAEERKDHCIQVHKFPQNFRFENHCMVSSSKPSANAKRNNMMMVDEPMNREKAQVSKSHTNFSFGQGKGKTFNRKSYGKLLSKTESEYKNTLEDSKTVTDLLNSLPA